MNAGEIIEELLANHDYISIGSHLAMCFSDYKNIELVTNNEFKEALERYLYSLELDDFVSQNPNVIEETYGILDTDNFDEDFFDRVDNGDYS